MPHLSTSQVVEHTTWPQSKLGVELALCKESRDIGSGCLLTFIYQPAARPLAPLHSTPRARMRIPGAKRRRRQDRHTGGSHVNIIQQSYVGENPSQPPFREAPGQSKGSQHGPWPLASDQLPLQWLQCAKPGGVGRLTPTSFRRATWLGSKANQLLISFLPDGYQKKHTPFVAEFRNRCRSSMFHRAQVFGKSSAKIIA